jgi:type I restriction enzyme M protein
VIVPEGVLFGSTGAHLALRKKLVNENQIKAVISLPGGVFQPYTSVKTSILLLQKGGQTDTIWFYEVSADGESLNAKRTPQPEQNDLWDLVIHYRLHSGLAAPAFVTDAAWAEWQALTAEARQQSYAQPELRNRLEQSEEGEAVQVRELANLVRQETTESKVWMAGAIQLQENDYNGNSGFI